MSKLDEIDLSILGNLQKNGRMTNVELASRAGISAPPCLRRLKSLETNGIIRGYYADIETSVVGYNFEALCFVSLLRQSAAHVKEFLDRINSMMEIRSCHATTGEFDFILRIVARDFKSYEDFLSTNLSSIDNISQIKTHVIMKCTKDEKGVPIS